MLYITELILMAIFAIVKCAARFVPIDNQLYCAYGTYHVACPDNQYQCNKIKPEILTPEEQDMLEARHNKIRTGFAHATLHTKIGLKEGKHIPIMKWNNTLARIAERTEAYLWPNELQRDDCIATDEYPRMGQNFFWSSHGYLYLSNPDVIKSALETWKGQNIHLESGTLGRILYNEECQSGDTQSCKNKFENLYELLTIANEKAFFFGCAIFHYRKEEVVSKESEESEESDAPKLQDLHETYMAKATTLVCNYSNKISKHEPIYTPADDGEVGGHGCANSISSTTYFDGLCRVEEATHNRVAKQGVRPKVTCPPPKNRTELAKKCTPLKKNTKIKYIKKGASGFYHRIRGNSQSSSAAVSPVVPPPSV